MEITIELKKRSKDSQTIQGITKRALRSAIETQYTDKRCPNCGGSNLIAHIDEITSTEGSGVIHCDDCSNNMILQISHNAEDEISKVVHNFNECLLKTSKKHK
jgi:hypothetical protein